MNTPAVHDIDLAASAFWRLPEAERDAAFAVLRSEAAPRFYPGDSEAKWGLPSGQGFHALVTHADVGEATRRPDDFRSGQGAVSVMDLPVEFNEGFSSLLSMDGERHRRVRRIVTRAFAPRTLAKLSGTIDQVAAELVTAAVREGEGDFVAQVAAPLPLRIICAMTGVPPSEYEFVFSRSSRILGAFDPEYAAGHPDLATNVLSAGADLIELIDALVKERETDPRDDLASTLIQAEIDGERLTRAEVASFFILLLVAGNETTRHAISNGLLLLQDNPDQRDVLLADYDRYGGTAAEEIVRLTSPTVWMRRTVSRDCELNGNRYAEGDRMLLFYWSANRDESVFADPTRFDVTRDPNPHVGYGAGGPHHCLGAFLARIELVAVFRELLRQAPGLQLTGERARLESSFVNGYKRIGYRV
ncbi:cytochrome P450 [Streptomyces sp. SID13031]|uniref:cytochrome P450 n=1 Tax=Streptomyces sp. SID13031 TaxID=2706046 RepID=UPI0013C86050|nr:cytochrome P450 [Streptomyces sp. SID13031]NEA30517.1 cytochrome P450 [Streptomyces sp. SID13031]